jgi:hypothetical protein
MKGLDPVQGDRPSKVTGELPQRLLLPESVKIWLEACKEAFINFRDPVQRNMDLARLSSQTQRMLMDASWVGYQNDLGAWAYLRSLEVASNPHLDPAGAYAAWAEVRTNFGRVRDGAIQFGLWLETHAQVIEDEAVDEELARLGEKATTADPTPEGESGKPRRRRGPACDPVKTLRLANGWNKHQTDVKPKAASYQDYADYLNDGTTAEEIRAAVDRARKNSKPDGK